MTIAIAALASIARCEDADGEVCTCTACFGMLHGRSHRRILVEVVRGVWAVDLRMIERMINGKW